LYDREPKDRSRGRPYHLRVKSADGPVSEEHSGSAERLGRAQDRPQIARVLHSSERQKWTGLSFLQQDLQRALTPLHQRCDTLGRLAGDNFGEQFLRQNERFYVCADLRQQTFRLHDRRFAEEYSPEPKPAADGLFHDPKAFDSTISILRQLAPLECAPQFLQ